MNKANEKNHTLTRRTIIKGSLTVGMLAATSSFSPILMAADAPPALEHPFKKPKQYTDRGRCRNCGMMLNMWALAPGTNLKIQKAAMLSAPSAAWYAKCIRPDTRNITVRFPLLTARPTISAPASV